MSNWQSWGEVFNHYRRNGHDLSSAAYQADKWEVRTGKIAPVAIKRAIKEVSQDDEDRPSGGYNRVYNRHNRS